MSATSGNRHRVLITFSCTGACVFLNEIMFGLKIFGRKKSVKVQCWFCQAATTVPVGNVNCFDCPECDQYNGFTKDGGYNKPIPAQYSEELNQTYSRPSSHQDESEPRPSPFCGVCQVNQELKIQQLAAFVPSHEKNFDVEVEQYAEYLEEAYRLCPACSDNVYSELHRQDADIRFKLLGQRLHQSGMPNAQTLIPVQGSGKLVFLCRSLAIIAAVLIFTSQLSLSLNSSGSFRRQSASFVHMAFQHVTVLESHRMTVSLMGLVCGVLSSLLAGKYRLKYLDCLCPLLWMIYMGNITAPALLMSLRPLFPWLPMDAIPMIFSTCVLCSCLKHALQSREQPSKKVFTNRRLRNQPISTPLLQEDEGEPTILLHPTEASSSTTTPSVSLSQSLPSENGEIKRILLDQDIGGLSLGPPGVAKARNKDVWTAHTPPTSRPATPLSEERPSSREFRPIISPATFNPSGMKRSASQTSFMSSFSGTFPDSGPFQDHRVSSSRENLVERGGGRSLPIFDDNSSCSSLPLCMNTKESAEVSPQESLPVKPVVEHKTTMPAWMSVLLPGILGFSLGINCAAALYFVYGR